MSNKDAITYNDSLWADPTNNLSGQIRLELEELEPGLRFTVYLALQNHAADSIAITNQPQIDATLFDKEGKQIATNEGLGSGPMPVHQWTVLPPQALIALRIDQQGAAYPTKEHREVLLATGGKSWRLKTGQYVLKVKALFNNLENGPANQWIGELDLPPVTVTVTEQMFLP